MQVQLKAGSGSTAWVKEMNKTIKNMQLVGFQVRLHIKGVRGLKTSAGDDDISIRVQGPNLPQLALIGDQLVDRLQGISGLHNLPHSYEDTREEINIVIDHTRAANLGMRVNDISIVLQVALEGIVVSEFIDEDRQYDIRLRLPRHQAASLESLNNTFIGLHQTQAIHLRDVTIVKRVLSPANIKHDKQRRIVDIMASLDEGATLSEVMKIVEQRLVNLKLPERYILYDGSTLDMLNKGQKMGRILLALFLVFVVMSVQYESLRNPLVIMLGVPFALIGVTAGLLAFNITLSMPVWLGLIMLAGIVVNNAIILVEQIEIEREKEVELVKAIITAARLRAILMTTLTTAIGMSPLALGIGSGAEMLATTCHRTGLWSAFLNAGQPTADPGDLLPHAIQKST